MKIFIRYPLVHVYKETLSSEKGGGVSNKNAMQYKEPGRSSFWYMNPTLRANLIRHVKDKAEEYKNNKEALMMRNINQLPAILAGESVLREETRVHLAPEVTVEEPTERAETPYFYIIPAEHTVPGSYWIPYPAPSSSNPNYRNYWQPTDQPIYVYGGPQEY